MNAYRIINIYIELSMAYSILENSIRVLNVKVRSLGYHRQEGAQGSRTFQGEMAGVPRF